MCGENPLFSSSAGMDSGRDKAPSLEVNSQQSQGISSRRWRQKLIEKRWGGGSESIVGSKAISRFYIGPEKRAQFQAQERPRPGGVGSFVDRRERVIRACKRENTLWLVKRMTRRKAKKGREKKGGAVKSECRPIQGGLRTFSGRGRGGEPVQTPTGMSGGAAFFEQPRAY